MNRTEMYEKWLQWQNYIIITVVSLISLFFLPMLGSSIGLAWVLPNTVAGWVVYVVSKLLVAILNVIIFHCFILQAKVNAKDHPRFVEANEILRVCTNPKSLTARSPKQYLGGVYGKKGSMIFISSVIAAVGLTQAVLTFDWVSMLTYLFTILMGVIFGVLQMNQTEIYWTEEYYMYAKQEKERMEMAKEACVEQKDDTTSHSGGTDLLEPIDCNSDSGSDC